MIRMIMMKNYLHPQLLSPVKCLQVLKEASTTGLPTDDDDDDDSWRRCMMMIVMTMMYDEGNEDDDEYYDDEHDEKVPALFSTAQLGPPIVKVR